MTTPTKNILSFAEILCVLLCIGCYQENIANAGFSTLWQIEDAKGIALSCEMLNASHVRISITDAKGYITQYGATCENGNFETEDWDIAAGEGLVVATLEDEEETVIAEVKEFTFVFSSGKSANALPVLVFVVSDSLLQERGSTINLSVHVSDSRNPVNICESSGTAFFSFILTDASGRIYELNDAPCRGTFNLATRLPTIATPGKALLEVVFRNSRFKEIDRRSLDVVISKDNIVSISVRISPPVKTMGGDVGITWQWTSDGHPLTEEDCNQIGIDYALIYIWDESLQSWWTDPITASAPCSAFDHAYDDALFGNDIYSGIYISRFLPPGRYKLSLGFYRVSGNNDRSFGSDVLVRFDSNIGGSFSDFSIGNHNIFVTDLSEPISSRGAVRIFPDWEKDDMNSAPVCGKDIKKMGVVLESEKGPASSLKLSNPIACSDELYFDNLPKLKHPYRATIYGLDSMGQMLRLGMCENIYPKDLSDADMSYHCLVSVLPPKKT